MKLESRHTIHFGINLVLAPAPVLDRPTSRRFQEYLEDADIAITNTQMTEQLVLARMPVKPLQISVGIVGPQVGQLLVLAPEPNRPIAEFCEEVEKIIVALDRAWPTQVRQLVHIDAAIRDLYDTSTDHAFKELWEQRLHQSPDSLQTLGPGLLGGGLRFVLPPADSHPMTPVIEVKMESFLQDSRKLFIEAQHVWPQPSTPGAPFEVTGRLSMLEEYMKTRVAGFIQEGQN
jgi:hypothetical protein